MKATLRLYLAVGAGAGLGAGLRYSTDLAVVGLGLSPLLATTLVNVLGSALIGFLATLTGPDGRLLVRPAVRLFVMVGLCGGLTTFSTMSLETVLLLRGGAGLLAMGYLAGLIAASLSAVWVGHVVAQALNAMRRRPK